MKYAVMVIVVSVAAVLVSGLAHALYSVMKGISVAFGGAA